MQDIKKEQSSPNQLTSPPYDKLLAFTTQPQQPFDHEDVPVLDEDSSSYGTKPHSRHSDAFLIDYRHRINNQNHGEDFSQNNHSLKSSTLDENAKNQMRILGRRDVGVSRRSHVMQQTPASNIFSQAHSNQSDKEESNKPINPFPLTNSCDSDKQQDQSQTHTDDDLVREVDEAPIKIGFIHDQKTVDGPGQINRSSEGNNDSESSRFFERAQNDTNSFYNSGMSTLKLNETTLYKITSLRDLLSLFNVRMNEDQTFEANGRSYQIDLHNKPNQPDNNNNNLQGIVSGYFPNGTSVADQASLSNINVRQDLNRTTFGNIIEVINIPKPQKQQNNESNNIYGMSGELGRRTLDLNDLLLSPKVKIQNGFEMPQFGGLGLIKAESLEESHNDEIFKHDFEIQVGSPKINSKFKLPPYQLSAPLKLPNNLNIDKLNKTISQHSGSTFALPSNNGTPNQNIKSAFSFNLPSNPIEDYKNEVQQIQQQIQKEVEEEELYEATQGFLDPMRETHKAKSFNVNLAKEISKNTVDSSSAHGYLSQLMKKGMSNISQIIVSDGSKSPISKSPQLTQNILKRTLSTGDQGLLGFKKDVSDIIMNMQQETLKLKEEKQTLQKQLLTQISSFDRGGINEKSIHLAFIYATPLVIRNNYSESKQKFKDKFRPQPLLQFKKEFQEIKESLKETQKNIKVRSLQGTIENFTNALGQQPLALHFTGHGTEDNELMLEHTYGEAEYVSEEQLKKILESSKAELDFVFVASCYSEFAGKIFQNIGVKHVICVKSGNTIGDDAVIMFSKVFYQLVFSQKMTICDSFRTAVKNCEVRYGPAEAGKFQMLEYTQFQKEKRKQDIAKKQALRGLSDQTKIPPKKVRQKKKFKGMPDLDDDILNIELPQSMLGLSDSLFYPPVLSLPPLTSLPLLPPLTQPIPEQQNISSSSGIAPTQIDMDEFPPIPDHVCSIFGPFSDGEFKSLDDQPHFNEIPQPVENFIGRQVELFEVTQTIMENRLVNIMGLPGIGKTALAKNAVHYIADRKLFKLGIIFFSLKGYKNCNVFMKKLVANIILSNFEFQPDQVQAVNEGNQEQMLSMIFSFFKKNPDEKLLVVFDNAEELIYYDNKPFRELITLLLEKCPGLKFLLTSRIWLGVLQDIQEKIIELKELSPNYSVDLLMSRVTKPISEEEKWELIKFKSESLGPFQDSKTPNSTNLANHNLFKILAGNPHAIILAAPLLIKKSLKELYILLSSDKLISSLAVDGVKDQAIASLCLSLEISVTILEKDNHDALAFFYLIGLLPGGIFKNELPSIWKKNSESDPGYEAHVQTLMKLSLLQEKEQAGDTNQQKLMLPPFINNYAEQTIENVLKKKFQENLCHYYAGICKDIYREDFKQSQKKEGKGDDQVTPRTRNNIEAEFQNQLRQKLLRHETNIWACIYRMAKNDEFFNELNLDKMLQEDLNSSINDKNNLMRRMSTRQYGNKNRERLIGAITKQSSPQVFSYRKNSHNNDFTPSSVELGKDIAKVLEISKKQISSNSGQAEQFQSPLIKIQNLPSVQEESVSNADDLYQNEMADFSKNSKFDQMDTAVPTDINVAPKFARRQRRATFNEGDSDSFRQQSTLLIDPIIEQKSHSEDTNSHYSEKSQKHLDAELLSNNGIEKEQYGPDFLADNRKKSKTSELNAPINKNKQSIGRKVIERLKNIMRYSHVKFNPRQSKLFNPKSRKNSAIEEEKKTPVPQIQHECNFDFDLTQGKKSHSVANIMPFFNQLGPSQSEQIVGNRMFFKTMNDQEKLIVYYSMNLYLLRDDENALKLIQKYVNKGTDLLEANIQRIMALIYLRKVDITEAMNAFKKANQIYQQIGCLYGEALTNFSMGFIYESKSSELLKTKDSPKKVSFAISNNSPSTPNDKAIHHFTQSKQQFEVLNHKVGIALCLEHLSVINKSIGKSEMQMTHAKEKIQLQSQINRYLEKYHKRCPHVQRIYGQDISLMTEVVTDNENRDLFSDMDNTSLHHHYSNNQLIHSANNFSYIKYSGSNDEMNPFYSPQLNLHHQVSAPNLVLAQLNSLEEVKQFQKNDSNNTALNPIFSLSITDESFFQSQAQNAIESPDTILRNENFSSKIQNFNPVMSKQFKLPPNTKNFILPKIDNTLDVVQEEEIPVAQSEKSPRIPMLLEVPKCPSSNDRKSEKQSPNSTLNRVVEDVKFKGKIIIEKAFGKKGSPNQQSNVSPISQKQEKECKSPPPEIEASQGNNDSQEKKSQLTMIERGIEIGKDLYKVLGARIRKNTNENL